MALALQATSLPGVLSGRAMARRCGDSARNARHHELALHQSMDAIQIDGSLGEGGGQVLRTSLALSLITGKSFRMDHIRARRPKPGMMPQHLKAVEAAAAVGRAHTEGASWGSQRLIFEPSGIWPGEFSFEIGTAGATALVLQTVLIPLSFAGAGSRITLTGGTHVPWSPCFHYLDLHWVRYMSRIGFDIRLEMELAGFYPQGCGKVHATVQPTRQLSPLCVTERGDFRRIRGISAVANLDSSVAERQRRRALSRLAEQSLDATIETVRMPSRFRGTMLLLIAEFESSQCCFYGLGALGKPAERVADEAVDGMLAFLATDGAIDQYLADQLVLPLSLTAGISELHTSEVTTHLVTNAEIVRLFLPVQIEIAGEIGRPGSIRIESGGFLRRRRPEMDTLS